MTRICQNVPLMALLLTVLTVQDALSTSPSAASPVAKVLLLRGDVQVKIGNNAAMVLKQGDGVVEGSTIITGEKSFARLALRTQGQINVGPKSQIVVGNFPKEGPGLISIVKGQIRSQITPDPLKANEQSKLHIQTKTAALGVRGTDFETIYNPITQMTSLVTFSGEVKFAQIDKNTEPAEIKNIERFLRTERAVAVGPGQFSSANPNLATASIPVKISPAQLSSLKSNDTYQESSAQNKKSYQSPIPPGVPSKNFTNNTTLADVAAKLGKDMPPAMLAQAMNLAAQSKIEGAQVADLAKSERPENVADGDRNSRQHNSRGPASLSTAATTTEEVREEATTTEVASESDAITTENLADAPPAEGMVDQKTGAIAPPAGGFIDLSSGTYLPPPPGSTYDPNTGVYVSPPQAGGFDAATGQYLPPTGFKMTEAGTFAVDTPAVPAATNVAPTGASASLAPNATTATTTATTTAALAPVAPPVTTFNGINAIYSPNAPTSFSLSTNDRPQVIVNTATAIKPQGILLAGGEILTAPIEGTQANLLPPPPPRPIDIAQIITNTQQNANNNITDNQQNQNSTVVTESRVLFRIVY